MTVVCPWFKTFPSTLHEEELVEDLVEELVEEIVKELIAELVEELVGWLRMIGSGVSKIGTWL